jgi:hypothetical protein
LLVLVVVVVVVVVVLLTANGFIPVAVCYNARRDSTVQYNTITHVTHDNIQNSRQLSICKITNKIKNIHYTRLRLRNE